MFHVQNKQIRLYLKCADLLLPDVGSVIADI